MANPRDVSANALLNGEFYLNERTGRTHVRLPAGGAGGGVTSYADQPATEEQHVAYLRSLADAKKAETDVLNAQHDEAKAKLEEKTAEDEIEETNPIGPETYGRPPVNPAGIDGEPQQHNPADERDPVDDQPLASPVKEHEAV